VLPQLRFEAGVIALQECAFEDGQPVIGPRGPDCRGSPRPTGKRVRATLVLPYEFRQP
jgi:hypothetical protein